MSTTATTTTSTRPPTPNHHTSPRPHTLNTNAAASQPYNSNTTTTPPDNPTSPTRPGSSPPIFVRSLWEVSSEYGCVPHIDLVRPSPDDWWALDSVPKSFAPFFQLVADLPTVLQIPGEIQKRVDSLPFLKIFGSKSQMMQFELELAAATGPGHLSPTCPYSHFDMATTILNNDLERETIFATFAFLANALVFGSHPQQPQQQQQPFTLPVQISEPLLRLAQQVGRQPITDYACSVLTNWRLRDPTQPFDVENIQILRTFTGTVAEQWFYAIHVCIEQRGGQALRAMTESREMISKLLHLAKLKNKGKVEMERGAALQRALSHSKTFTIGPRTPSASLTDGSLSSSTLETVSAETARIVAAHLHVVAEAVGHIDAVMARLPEHCPPEAFFDIVRPWLGSWPEPYGVTYATACQLVHCPRGREITMKLSGASGAQSSLLPSIDGFLGISYGRVFGNETSETSRTDSGAFVRQLKKFRNSMPPPHRHMISLFENEGNVRQLVATLEETMGRSATGTTPELRLMSGLDHDLNDLKRAYNECIMNLISFRKRHTDFATKYIRSMAVKKGMQSGGGTSQAAAAAAAGQKGTGGSDYQVHLSRHVADTKKSLYTVNDG